MQELLDAVVDQHRRNIAKAIDDYVVAESAALRDVAAAVEAWFNEALRPESRDEWRVGWDRLLAEFRQQGIEIVEPSSEEIAQLFVVR
jgi:hypothetical protein